MAESAYRANQWIEAGLTLRGSIRLALTKAGFEFTETKSWTASVFRVKCTPAQWESIRRDLERV